ncbi:MAG: hypothetical protein JSS67_03065 [Bacteroidetes bacterium]|nr:hypothetical protein [Bacteroidota bacterium]
MQQELQPFIISPSLLCGNIQLLQRNPQLKFELIDVLIRTNRLTLYYSNASANQKSDEIIHFNKNFQVDEEVINYSE